VTLFGWAIGFWLAACGGRWLLLGAGCAVLHTAVLGAGMIGVYPRVEVRDFHLLASDRQKVVAMVQAGQLQPADRGASRTWMGALYLPPDVSFLVAREGLVVSSHAGPDAHVLFPYESQGLGEWRGILYRHDDVPLPDPILWERQPDGWRLFQDLGIAPRLKFAPHWYLVYFSPYIRR
jgi:hypothetical protein